jgi:hypothetical protein
MLHKQMTKVIVNSVLANFLLIIAFSPAIYRDLARS